MKADSTDNTDFAQYRFIAPAFFLPKSALPPRQWIRQSGTFSRLKQDARYEHQAGNCKLIINRFQFYTPLFLQPIQAQIFDGNQELYKILFLIPLFQIIQGLCRGYFANGSSFLHSEKLIILRHPVCSERSSCLDLTGLNGKRRCPRW